MPNTFFGSDHHLFHKKIIESFGRPFSNIEEHNETIIKNHNEVVREQDIVYFLGDVLLSDGSGKPFDYTILNRFNGKKRLIVGNHDTSAKIKAYADYFEKIMGYHEFPKHKIFVSHVPIHPSQLDERFKANVHGHVHSATLDDNRYVNVSLENTDYYPVSLDTIIDRLHTLEIL